MWPQVGPMESAGGPTFRRSELPQGWAVVLGGAPTSPKGVQAKAAYHREGRGQAQGQGRKQMTFRAVLRQLCCGGAGHDRLHRPQPSRENHLAESGDGAAVTRA